VEVIEEAAIREVAAAVAVAVLVAVLSEFDQAQLNCCLIFWCAARTPT
jgi:hypothetical protein